MSSNSKIEWTDATIVAGKRFRRDDGAEIRIDRVANDWVYYAAWEPGWKAGNLNRMPTLDFKATMWAGELSGRTWEEVPG